MDRINARDTPWHAEDLSIAALPSVAGVVLPKAEDDASVGDLLSAGARAVLPLIESAAGSITSRRLPAPTAWSGSRSDPSICRSTSACETRPKTS